jgi:hypothetical protein
MAPRPQAPTLMLVSVSHAISGPGIPACAHGQDRQPAHAASVPEAAVFVGQALLDRAAASARRFRLRRQ